MKKSFNSLPTRDEELVLLCQNGCEESWEKLTHRYLYRARTLAICVLPEFASHFQQIDIEECMLITIMNAAYTFSPTRGKFFQFLLAVYRNELIKMLKVNESFTKYTYVSLNDIVPGTEETLTFEDVIPDENEDPTSFCDPIFVSGGVSYVFDNLDELTKQIVLLKIQGKSYKEIAEDLHVSYKVARSRFLKYKSIIDTKFRK